MPRRGAHPARDSPATRRISERRFQKSPRSTVETGGGRLSTSARWGSRLADQRTDRPLPAAGTRVRRRDRARAGLRRVAPFAEASPRHSSRWPCSALLVPGPRALTPADVKSGVEQALASMTPPPARSQVVYAAVRPSLVLVKTGGRRHRVAAGIAGGHARCLSCSVASPLPRRIAGALPGRGPRRRPAHRRAPVTRTAGSAAASSSTQRGDILTSLHVVDGATSITVTFADGTARRPTSAPASRTTTSPSSRRTSCPPPSSRRRSAIPRSVQVGSEAYVIGNPFGLYGSISAGVVSGVWPVAPGRYGRQGAEGPHPGGRGGQPRQLRRVLSSTATARSSGSSPRS